MQDLRLDDLDRMLAVNVRGPLVVAQAALPLMPDGGRIVNLASELAYLGRAGASAYAATKGAVLSMTRSWAREFAPRILVNGVAPGPVDTPLLGFDRMSGAERALETANPLGRSRSPRRSPRWSRFSPDRDRASSRGSVSASTAARPCLPFVGIATFGKNCYVED